MTGSPAEQRLPRFDLEATVVSHDRIIGNEYEIVFHAPPIARTAQPGQFLELLFGENYAPLVRRPFSLYRVNRETGTFSVLYLARGAFTKGMAQKEVGDCVSVLGPLGRPFTWQPEPNTRYLLIAGGIGAPPIYFLAREMKTSLTSAGIDSSDVVVINAARTRDMLVGMVEFSSLDIQLHVSTDDGSHGLRGMATELLIEQLEAAPDRPARLFTCGPMPMLRAIAEIAIRRGLPCQVSIETAMPCGLGTCQGCAVPIHDRDSPDGFRYVRACWEGPVFPAQDLVW